MKKITLLLFFVLAVKPAFSQCTPMVLPYAEGAETANVPALPDCMQTMYITFASNEMFKTTANPPEGFSGNVFVYSSQLAEWVTGESPTGVNLYTQELQLTAGSSYVLSFKYGLENAESVIDNLDVYLNFQNNNTDVAILNNLTGNGPVTYTSEPFTAQASGPYRINFAFYMQGNQGNVYLDDISVEETNASVKENELSGLAVYPIPAGNEIHLDHAGNAETAELYTITGQKILSQAINSGTGVIDSSSLTSGIYLLKITSGNAQRTIKIIKA